MTLLIDWEGGKQYQYLRKTFRRKKISARIDYLRANGQLVKNITLTMLNSILNILHQSNLCTLNP